jgi:hypothetical protein
MVFLLIFSVFTLIVQAAAAFVNLEQYAPAAMLRGDGASSFAAICVLIGVIDTLVVRNIRDGRSVTLIAAVAMGAVVMTAKWMGIGTGMNILALGFAFLLWGMVPTWFALQVQGARTAT